MRRKGADMREKLILELEEYCPFNEQEARDRETILKLLRNTPDIFERSNSVAHMTASAWVVNHDRTKVLMAYHNIYDSWSWLGGHADGETNLEQVALREVREESGVENVRPVSDDIFSVEVLTVDGHEKRGAYVGSHLHLNLTWLVEADESEPLRNAEGENSDVAWFTPEEVFRRSTEPWFVKRIYRKLAMKTAIDRNGGLICNGISTKRKR